MLLDIRELTYAEKAALTEDEIEKYIDSAIMQAGILKPAALAVEASMEASSEPAAELCQPLYDCTIHVVNDAAGNELAFTEHLDAVKLSEFLSGSSQVKVDSEYMLGDYSHKFYHITDKTARAGRPDTKITTISAYSANTYREYLDYAKKLKASAMSPASKASETISKYHSAVAAIHDEVYSEYNFAVERGRTLAYLRGVYVKYLEYSKGDVTVAKKFMSDNADADLSNYNISIDEVAE